MKRIHMLALLTCSVGALATFQDVFARGRMYHPGLGQFMQRDPIGYAGGMNVYQYVGGNPPGFVDPYGLLQRRQLDYLGQQYVQGWPGIDPATKDQIRAAIAALKKTLLEQFPDAGFSAGDKWSLQDDIAMQRALDASRKDKDSPWQKFPGNTYKCYDCKGIGQAIKDALAEFNKLGGTLAVDQNLVLAWTMKESSWNEAASAYGSSAGSSTAIGLLQIVKSTYNDYAKRNLFTKEFIEKYGAEWDEGVLSSAEANAIAGIFVLQGKAGDSIADKLGNYYGSKDEKANASYAEKILKGKDYLDNSLKGKSLDQLSDEDCKKLITELDKIVH